MRRILLSVLSVAYLTTFVDPINGQTKPPLKNVQSAPYTDQEILLLFGGQSANNRIILMLNNNRPDSLTADLTLYGIDGTTVPLPAVQLIAAESRLIELGQSLREANITAPLGYLRIHYSGRNMELGAQLTLYPIENRGGLDSPRSLRGDFVSTERHAVAWLPPASTAVVSLTNISDSPITTSLSINGHKESVVVQPQETILRERHRESLVADQKPSLIDLDISFEGPKDAIRAFGYVKSKDDGSLPLRIYDPQSATMKTLSAVGLTVTEESHLVVRNLTALPILITPHLVEVGSQAPFTSDGPPVLILGHSSVEVPLSSVFQPYFAKSIARVTLLLKSNAPLGALVGSITQRSAPGLLEDIPLKTSNPVGFMRGAYPLRWEGDYTNRPMVANTSDQDAKVRAYVIAGGVTYIFPITTVKPGTTLDFDVDYIRANKIPDISGKVIPLDAKFGKFHWAPAVGDIKLGLHGRTELKSFANLRASSFSCGVQCAYELQSYPYFDFDPFGSFPFPYTTGARSSNASMYTLDGYGNYTGYDSINYYTYAPITPEATSIVSNTPINNNLTLRSDTGTPGDTNVVYHFYELEGVQDEEGSFCYYPDVGYDITQPTSVGTPAPLVSSSCTTGSNGNLTGGWGVFGGCVASGMIYSVSANESCVTGNGKYGTKQCAESNVNGCITRTCPIDDRTIKSDCSGFADNLTIAYVQTRMNCP